MFTQAAKRTIFTPLGFRFWDPVKDIQVKDGLEVTARPAVAYGRLVKASPTLSGNYAFHGLPGLHHTEYPLDNRADGSDLTKLIIEVRDDRHQFLPVAFAFEEKLPLPYKGVYKNDIFRGVYPATPPDAGSPVVHLFSAPTRQVSAGLAVVRAQLKDFPSGKPAAHAVVEVRIKERRLFGLADEKGNAAVYFPYPTADKTFGMSPPVSSRSLARQRWPLLIAIHYSPDTVIPLPGTELPDLRTVLGQRRALVRASMPTSPVNDDTAHELQRDLEYGQELVLRTENESELWIDSIPTSP